MSHSISSPQSGPEDGMLQRMDSLGSQNRAGSYGSLYSFHCLGEQAQTQFLDANRAAFEEGIYQSYNNNQHNYSQHNYSNHQNNGGGGDDISIRSSVSLRSSNHDGYYPIYSSSRSIMSKLPSASHNTIRFQVIIWSVAQPDVKVGKVSMKFRVTLFWNDVSNTPSVLAPQPQQQQQAKDNHNNNMSSNSTVSAATNTNNNTNNTKKVKQNGPTVWVMHGRKQASEKKMKSHTNRDTRTIDIPPVSILNADSFETIGRPEVMLLQEDTKLMRWTCMYRAKLTQDEMSVCDFPHDTHRLSIQLGILSQRHPGGRWDRRKWKLALANESDTQGSIRIPHGLLVNHVKIPEFQYDTQKELDFDLLPLNHGSIPSSQAIRNVYDTDYYLRTSIVVTRDSGYYDNNILPLLGMLNLVAISILCLDATNFFKRALLAINIAFLEIGLRMTLDNRLPHVGYTIKMQRVLNWFFYSILWELLESSVLKYTVDKEWCSIAFTRHVDFVVSSLLLVNQFYLTLYYQKREGLGEKWMNSMKEGVKDMDGMLLP